MVVSLGSKVVEEMAANFHEFKLYTDAMRWKLHHLIQTVNIRLVRLIFQLLGTGPS